MVITLAWNAREVSSILVLGTFPILIITVILVVVTMILYKLLTVWLFKPTLCVYI